MAMTKLFLASILLAILVVHGVQAIQTSQETSSVGQDSASSPKINCGAACAERCKLSGRPHLCKRACGTCCAKCNCVPPGTYGNYEACACYAKLTTHGKRPKCP